MRRALIWIGLIGACLASSGRNPQVVQSQVSHRPALFEQSGGVQWSVSPPSGSAPLTVTFEATSNNKSANYAWNFGDGSVGSGPKVRYTFYRPGEYRARLEVRFPNGARSQGEIPIRAVDAGPERARMTVLVDTGTRVMFDARTSVVYAPFTTAHWNFSDGTSADGLVVHKIFAPGQYAVSLELSAPSGRLTQTLKLRTGTLSGNASFEDDVLRLTNDARARGYDCDTKSYPAQVRALNSLRRDAQLDVAARAQSAAMALNDYFAHESALDGSKPADRATSSGYAWWNIAENIASGQETPAAVVTAWLQSHPHCVNIMAADLTEIGISYVLNAQNRPYWTQVFGKPRD